GSSSGVTASTSTSSTAQVRSIIKPTIKHGPANHRYQLIGSGAADVKLVGAGEVRQTRGSGHWQDRVQEVEADLCDESTNLLAGTGVEDDDDVDEREIGIDDRPRRPGAVKSDKNFNNLIVVTNGRHTKPTNGNHAAPAPKLASALKPTNGVGSAGGPVRRPGSSGSNSGGSAGHTSASAGPYYNGYIAVSGDNDDEHHRMLVSANNLRNTNAVDPHQECNTNGRHGTGEGFVTTANTDPPRSSSSTFTSTVRTTTNGNCRTMNSLNGNLMGTEPPPVVAPLPLEPTEMGGGAADVSLGSDSDSATGAGGSGSVTTGGGGKKVKLNKLGGNKNVTLKRVL
uniref:Uncharacterized protein n=1 Tax=Anopheles maculatus TaxID=74869 RepID=A0A182S7U4_9DIPT